MTDAVHQAAASQQALGATQIADAASTVAITSPASTAVFAGEQLHQITQGDSQHSAGHTLASVSGKTSTLFTHSGGLEAVAAHGPLSLQAHTDQLELLADKDVTVVSVNDSIVINAKSAIVMKAGQSSIALEGANITMACPGTFSVKGSGLGLDDGARGEADLAELPAALVGQVGFAPDASQDLSLNTGLPSDNVHSLRLDVGSLVSDGQALDQTQVQVWTKGEKPRLWRTGQVDMASRSVVVETANAQELEFVFGDPEWETHVDIPRLQPEQNKDNPA